MFAVPAVPAPPRTTPKARPGRALRTSRTPRDRRRFPALAAAAAVAAALLASGCGAFNDEPATAFPPEGPLHPKLLKAYPLTVFAHCGVNSAEFAGETWHVSAVRTDYGAGEQGLDETGRHGDFIDGYMRQESKNRAVYEAKGLPVIEFTRGEGDPKPCM